MKKLILILLAITAIAAGCQKYEEGPLISFRSARNRLYGRYTLTKYTVDGADSIQQMKDRLGLEFHFYYHDDNDDDVLVIDGDNIYHEPFITRYAFINHDEDIRLYYGSRIFNGINTPPQDVIFVILKLKTNDIHLKTSFNNKEYYFELN